MDPTEDLGRRGDTRKERQFRRTVALQIYLPMAAVIVLMMALGVSAGLSGYGSASVWADIALMLVLLPLAVMVLLAVAAVAALVVGIGKLPRWVRMGGARAGAIVDRVGEGVIRVADGAARPVILVHGAAAVVRRAGGLLGSLFRAR